MIRKDDIRNKLLKDENSRWFNIYTYARRFTGALKRDCVPQFAAQSAFFAVTSAVPFIMIVILCLKYVLDVNVTDITGTIYRAFPVPVSTYMSKILSEVFFKTQSTALWSLTVITMLWTSSRGTMAVYMGINTISGDISDKSWLELRIVSFIYNIIFLAVLVATIIVLVFGNTILKLLDEINLTVGHYILKGIFEMKYMIFFVLFVLAFAALYTFFPRKRLKYKKQLPGAVITAIGWLLFSFGFSIYISHFSRYSFLYGSLAAIVIMMFWLYFCIYILLAGAEVNKLAEEGFFKEAKENIFRKKAEK